MAGQKERRVTGLAAFAGFDIFVTLDKNLRNQQNLDKVVLKFIVLLARNNKHQTLQPFVGKIEELLRSGAELPKLSVITAD